MSHMNVGLKRMDLGLHATTPTVKNTIYSLLNQLDSFIYKKRRTSLLYKVMAKLRLIKTE
jgi:hypothetical protein